MSGRGDLGNRFRFVCFFLRFCLFICVFGVFWGVLKSKFSVIVESLGFGFSFSRRGFFL